jgi:hypothetical protein
MYTLEKQWFYLQTIKMFFLLKSPHRNNFTLYIVPYQKAQYHFTYVHFLDGCHVSSKRT